MNFSKTFRSLVAGLAILSASCKADKIDVPRDYKPLVETVSSMPKDQRDAIDYISRRTAATIGDIEKILGTFDKSNDTMRSGKTELILGHIKEAKRLIAQLKSAGVPSSMIDVFSLRIKELEDEVNSYIPKR